MAQSMTAYARHSYANEHGQFTWELRAVNHRYLDIALYLPELLREIEMPLRKQLREYLQRGKIECWLRYQPVSTQATQVTTNQALADALINLHQSLKATVSEAQPINLMQIMQWPGVVSLNNEIDASMVQLIIQEFDVVLKQLITTRAREGAALIELIKQRCQQIKQCLQIVRRHAHDLINLQRQQLHARCAELQLTIEPERLEQEIVLLVQKNDIHEEIDRLDTHLTELNHVLATSGSIGRRLDFLIQEMNREVNTIGSKSNLAELRQAVVDIKVLLEQIREQIQNIE
ncbi:MAG: YicC family protein [Gammaproteobacteria bacterium]